MKKNWIMRAAYLTLAVLLISTVVVSGTFAKYTWAAVHDGRAQVAKFAFDIAGNTITKGNETISIDLFDTIVDTADGQMDTEVLYDGTTNTRLAPGTQGSFDLSFKNNSEVAVAVNFDATLTNAGNIPLKFQIVKDGVEGEWVAFGAFTLDSLDNTNVAIGAAATTTTINWKWDFVDGADEDAILANNEIDTDLGFGANVQAAEAILRINLAVEQID